MSATVTTRTTGATGMAAGLRFWVGWVLASTIGGLVALSMGAEFPWGVGALPSGDAANTDGYGVAWAVVVAGLLAGAVLGGIQWLFLRSRLSVGRSSGLPWVAASAIGFAESFTVVWAASGGVHGSEYAHHGLPHAVDRAETWGGLLIGALLGVAQWLVLRAVRPQLSRSAWWWIAATALGFTIGWWAAAVMSAPVEAALGPMTHFWGAAVFGVVFGAITGCVLVWLLRRPANADTV